MNEQLTNSGLQNTGLLILARFSHNLTRSYTRWRLRRCSGWPMEPFRAYAGGLFTTFLLNHNPDFNRKMYPIDRFLFYALSDGPGNEYCSLCSDVESCNLHSVHMVIPDFNSGV